jgi:tetratricopeptide (TPR) repeat protein
MTGARWWIPAAAAIFLGLAGPARAEDPGDTIVVEEGPVDTDSMFEFLVAEVAAQRGDIDGAIAIYTRLAREMKDPAIAKRAVETAIRARAFGPAMDSAMLLLELDPESALSREIMSALLGSEGGIDKARDTVAGLLDKAQNRGPVLIQLSQLFAKYPDKTAVLEAVRQITAKYPIAESRYAVGVAALLANQPDVADAEADAALRMRPGWEQAAILKAQVLRRTTPDQVIAFYQSFIASNPEANEVRMQLGRELAGDHRIAEARDQFAEVEKRAKNDSQASYAVGLLSLQLEDYPAAQGAFDRALKENYREPTAVYLGLGQAAEGLKQYDEAIRWYQKVESSDWIRAQLKIATLITRQQGLPAGREYLHNIDTHTPDDRIQVIQVEAQLLRDAKEWQATYEMLTKAVEEYPESYELLYDRAMAAERVNKLEVLESDLRKVIQMKPDYAHAYNALGYTLADRTTRLSEAKELIDKAYKLSPDDPFILDSLGWVYFRLGNNPEALKYLQIAYTSRSDPEIAAHLGEVLWTSGKHEEARKVWRDALVENPAHEALLAAMQKHQP